MNVLIGAVGYKNLRDLTFGPAVLDRLAEMDWPAGIELEDLSYGPVAVMQNLEDTPGKYGRAILVSAVPRDRQPGMLEFYRWQPPELSIELVQERIGEGVTGIVSLDNLLIICQHFGVLPPEVICVEVEPVETEFGLAMSAIVATRFEEAVTLVRREALREVSDASRGGVRLRD